MKKLFLLTLFLLVLSLTANAEPIKDDYNGFYGLFEEITDITIEDFSSQITANEANKITNLFFGKSPFEEEHVLRKDIIMFLSENCTSDASVPPLEFQDAGLIAKDARKAYSALNGNGRLYNDGEFLDSDSPLTYDYLIGSLSMFEDEILKNLRISKSEGMIANISLEKNNIVDIKLLMMYSAGNIKFKDMETKNIYINGFLTPYSRNLAKGDRVVIYTNSDGMGIYVKFQDYSFQNYRKLSSDYSLYKGEIYYIDKEFAVAKNVSFFDGYQYSEKADTLYSEFKIDESTIFKHNFNTTDYEYINENLLDKTVFIICDKSENAKYINLSE